MERKNIARFIGYSAIMIVTVLACIILYRMWDDYDEKIKQQKEAALVQTETVREAETDEKEPAQEEAIAENETPSVAGTVTGLVKGLAEKVKSGAKENDKKPASRIRATEPELDSAEQYLQRGSDHIMRGNLEAGIRNLEAAVRLDPHYYPILNNARKIQRRLAKAGRDRLTAGELRRAGDALRPVDAERNVDAMGIPMTLAEREALKEKARKEYKGGTLY
jgi:vacuolar-type H+-ATPase subunit I/STV1